MATGSAQSLPPPYAYPSVIIVLITILLLFFFFGFLSVYFCRHRLCRWRLLGPPAAGTGLDPLLVQTFPTFTHSTAAGSGEEGYGLECAICLVEFRGGDVLRQLTACRHVFHRECVDLWLRAHRTCPVCRRKLDSPIPSPVKSPVIAREEEAGVGPESHVIAIKEGDDGDAREAGMYGRSHSTGHSVGVGRVEGLEKYTVVLPPPEPVQSNIVAGHHNPSQSWPMFEEYKAKSNTTASDGGGCGGSGGGGEIRAELSGGGSEV